MEKIIKIYKSNIELFGKYILYILYSSAARYSTTDHVTAYPNSGHGPKGPFTNDVIVLRGRGSPNYDGGERGVWL